MISNRRIYANPNSAETAIFEHELEEAGIQFLRHDPGVTLGYAPSSFLVQSVVYTFFEEDEMERQVEAEEGVPFIML